MKSRAAVRIAFPTAPSLHRLFRNFKPDFTGFWTRGPVLVAVSLCMAIPWIGGCAVEPIALDPLPFGSCACQEAGGDCPTSVCDLRVELDKDTCTAEVGVVEVMIGGQLETTIWKPGDRSRTCATIARGGSVVFVARADTAWRWQEQISCPPQTGAAQQSGPTIVRVLHCTTDP